MQIICLLVLILLTKLLYYCMFSYDKNTYQ